MKKIFLSIAMLFVLICSSIVYADDIDSGTCGENLTWTLNDKGTLIISGTGNITDYTAYDCAPWMDMYSDKINSVIIENGVGNIGSYAFAECNNLINISIADSVTTIGYYAFNGCSSLTDITLPNSITSIGSDAFLDTGIYNNENNWNDGMLYIGNNLIKAHDLELVEIKDNTKCLAGGAFSDCPNLTSISLPDGIIGIGTSAFSGCTNLTNITLPDSITYINHHAFSGCSNLTDIEIPANVTYIGDRAFEECVNLTQITIPESVKRIDQATFRGCKNITTIHYNAINCNIYRSYYGEFAWKGAFSDCEKLSKCVIGDKVTVIPEGLLYGCTGIKDISLPDSLTHIDRYAFSGCSGLCEITIPKNVSNISNNAFGGCSFNIINYNAQNCTIDYTAFTDTNIADIRLGKDVMIIPDGLFKFCTGTMDITIPDNVIRIEDRAFKGCGDTLRSITIPESVISIGKYAFEECTGLTNVTFKNGLKYIDDDAFSGCSNLTNITLPESVTYIGSGAFSGCTNLANIKLPNNITSISGRVFSGCSNLTNIILPVGIQTIEYGTFEKCSNLTNITLPNGITSISNDAFSGCSKLAYIEIPDSVTYIGGSAFNDTKYYNNKDNWENGALYIGNHLIKAEKSTSIKPGTKYISSGAFEHRTDLASIEIPDSVTYIGNNAFSGCSNLANITLPESVTYIGASAFSRCSNLTNVTLPESVTYIGYSAFSECSNLTNVKLSDSITFIGGSAFKNCSNLTDIIIPNKVQLLISDTFNGCTSLNNIKLNPNVKQIEQTAFQNTGYYNNKNNWENGALYLDNCLLTADKQVSQIKNGTFLIADSAFENCVNLPDIILPDTMKYIGNNAFKNCSNLNNIIIPNNVAKIGSGAFNGCKNLTNITIPSSVITIGSRAFSDCTKLANIALQDGITEIDAEVFVDTEFYNNKNNWDNGALYINNYLIKTENNSIKSGTKLIAAYAFENCTNTKNITLPESIEYIGYNAFRGCTFLESISLPKNIKVISGIDFFDSYGGKNYAMRDVYYAGSEDEWNNISKTITDFRDVNIHFNKSYFNGKVEGFNVQSEDENIIVNASFSEMDGNTAIFSVYDNAGKLLDIKTELISNDTVQLEFKHLYGDLTIKLMVWSSMESMIPLTESQSKEITIPKKENYIKFNDSILQGKINKQISSERLFNMPITKEELESLTKLYLDGDITDLEGLQYAKNLKLLYLQNTKLTYIPEYIFAEMTQLEELALWSKEIDIDNSNAAIKNLEKINNKVLICLADELMNVRIMPEFWDIDGLSLSCPNKIQLWNLDYAIRQAEDWGLSYNQIEQLQNFDYSKVKLVDYWEENYKQLIEENPDISMKNPAENYIIEPALENNFDFTNGLIRFRVKLKRNPNIYMDIYRGFTGYSENNINNDNV